MEPNELYERWMSVKLDDADLKEELESIRALYEADFSLYSQALTSYFEKPEDVSLRQFFYNGHLDCRIHPETYMHLPIRKWRH